MAFHARNTKNATLTNSWEKWNCIFVAVVTVPIKSQGKIRNEMSFCLFIMWHFVWWWIIWHFVITNIYLAHVEYYLHGLVFINANLIGKETTTTKRRKSKHDRITAEIYTVNRKISAEWRCWRKQPRLLAILQLLHSWWLLKFSNFSRDINHITLCIRLYHHRHCHTNYYMLPDRFRFDANGVIVCLSARAEYCFCAGAK